MNLDGYQIKQLASILNTEIIGHHEDKTVYQFVLDSRKNSNPINSLFICLKGNRHNAHDYLSDLYKQGFRSFIIDQDIDVKKYPEASFIKTQDSLQSFQRIAAYHRSSFDFPIIGITGSFGKTIIKEWLFQLLQDDFQIVRSPKSYNSQVGLPLSVLQIKPYHNLGIFEAGISQKGEMEKLRDILQCNIAIISNIGHAHLENFNDQSEILDEKSKLAEKANTIICSDKQADYFHNNTDKKVLSWGNSETNFLQVKEIIKDSLSTKLLLKHQDSELSLHFNFVDEYSIENVLHCVVSLLNMNYSLEVIGERVKKLKPVALRLQMKQGINDSIIIHDPYLKDAESLKISTDFLRQQKAYSKYILIHDSDENLDLSGIKEQLDHIISIGKKSSRFEHYYSVEDFNTLKDKGDFQNSAILIQGSFNHKAELLNQVLQEKTHQTVMEINLNHLVNNLNYFKSKLNPSTKVMAMVKAFSYGSGSDEIASLLQYHKVDYLGVAYADEGLALRKAGITLPIMVMNAEPSAFEMMIKNHLSPVIFNLRGLESFHKALSLNTDLKHFPIHIELETGMHRLGFNQEDLEQAKKTLLDHDQIKVQSVFSHLSASEDENKKEFTLQQINTFKSMCKNFREGLTYSIDEHILNTNGILRYPEYQMDMVRLGIGLYGVCGQTLDQKNLKEVSSLKTSISQIKWVKSESNVGYGGNNIGTIDRKIAILPIGYADGFRRSLSNGKGFVYINNHPATVIGKVCMDMTMVDITEIDCKEGEEVIIFNQSHSIKDFANQMQTIPYEALTGISPRVKREYYQE